MVHVAIQAWVNEGREVVEQIEMPAAPTNGLIIDLPEFRAFAAEVTWNGKEYVVWTKEYGYLNKREI